MTAAATAADERVAPSVVDAPPGVRDLPVGTVEMLDARTLTSKTYRLPSGELATRISTSPLHHSGPDGTWQDIDTTFLPFVGGFRNDANVLTTIVEPGGVVTVAREGAAARWVPEAARLRGDDGGLLASLETASVAPAVVGSEARFPGIFPHATDVYRVERAYVKHDTVLHRAPMASEASAADVFAIEGVLELTPGLRVVAGGEERSTDFETTGGVAFLNPDGSLAFRMHGVYAFDARHPAPAEEGGTPTSVDGVVRGAFIEGGLRLSMEVPVSWLHAKERAYPVTVDPTWGWDDVDASIYVRETEGNKNGDNFLTVGEQSGDFVFCCYYEYDDQRAFLRQVLSPIDDRVTSISQVRSDLYMYQSTGVSGTFHSYFVPTDSWSPSTTTWTNQPSMSTFLGSVVIGSTGWKTTLLSTGVVESQVWGRHVEKFNGDDQMSYGVRRSAENTGSETAVRFYRTGSLAPEWLVTYTIDAVAPTTGIATSGTVGTNGWFRSSVSVSLSCSDAGSGCYRTFFRVNGGSWQTYSSPFAISAQGVTVVDYYSQDKVLNNGPVQSTTIRIDTAAPSTGASVTGTLGGGGWYRSPVTVSLSCSDTLSGCAATSYRVDGGSWETYAGPFSIATSGAHAVDFQSRDAAGNWEAVKSIQVKVDTVLPLTAHALSGTLGGGGWFRSPVTVTLSASDAHSGVAAVQFRVDGGAWQAYSGPFVISASGAHAVDFQSRDVAGNWEAVRSIQVKVDAVLPSVAHALSGTVGGGGWYRSAVTVTLSASDAHSGVSSTMFRVDGGAWQAYSGPFSMSVSGTHALDYTVEDVAGNVRTVLGVPIRIDAVPPSVSATLSGTLGDGGWYRSVVDVAIACSDSHSGCASTEYRVDGGSWNVYAGAFPVAAEGTHVVEYTARDVAGNVAPIRSTTFGIDTVAPATTAVATGTVGGGGWYTSPVDVVLSSTDATSGVGSTYYRVDGGAWLSYGAPLTIVSSGETTVDYFALDVAGNRGDVGRVTVRLDLAPPQVAAGLAGDGPLDGWYRSAVTVTLSASDAHSGVDVAELSLDGGASWATYDGPFAVDDEGVTTVHYRATDVAGHVASDSVEVRIDVTAPATALTIGGPVVEGDETFVSPETRFTLTAADALSGVSLVAYRVDGAPWVVYGAPFGIEGAKGERVIEYHSVDEAGNVEALHELRVHLDATPPEASLRIEGGSVPVTGGVLVGPSSVLHVDATDAASGVASVWHAVGAATFEAHAPFSLAVEGEHTVRYYAEDLLGNVAEVASSTVHLDASGPTVDIAVGEPSLVLENGTTLVTSATPLTLSAEDAAGVGAVEYRLAGGAWTTYGGAFDLSGHAGSVAVEYRATDAFGNVAPTQAVTLVVDDAAPELAIVSPRQGSVTAGESTLDTDSDGDGYADAAEAALGSDPLDEASTPAGLDALSPPETGTPADGALRRAYVVKGSDLVFEVEATDVGEVAAGVAEVRFLIDGVLAATLTEAPYEWTWDTTDAEAGEHVVTVVAVDGLGNEASVDFAVHVLPAEVGALVGAAIDAWGAVVA